MHFTHSPAKRPPFEADIKAVLLVGGLGTRLRPVLTATPKALASVGPKPFLRLLVDQLLGQGIRHLVMCTGHLSHQIETEFGNGCERDVTIEYSKEESPLGTAGAVKFAAPHLRDISDFFVMNGDSIIEADFHRLYRFHHIHGGLATITVIRVQNAARYGTIDVGQDGRIRAFAEKTGVSAPGVINAGLYLFRTEILNFIPPGPVSLETAIFPALLHRGLFAFEQKGLFIDIGTPEDYARAQTLSTELAAISSR